jgi:hypothetical protein
MKPNGKSASVRLACLLLWPVIVMALSPLLFKERFTLQNGRICGSSLWNSINKHTGVQDGKTGWGLFCGGMSAIMYAFMVIFNKKAQSITGMRKSHASANFQFFGCSRFYRVRQAL